MLDSTLNTNVLSFRDHIGGLSICSHEVGTLPKQWMVYTKGNLQFLKDETDTYHYKDKRFKLTNGWFISDDVNIKLPQRTAVHTVERVALSLGITISSNDKIAEIDIEDTSFRTIMNILTTLALKDLSIVPSSFTQQKQLKYGEVVFSAYLKAVGGSGRIKATKPSIRWLNEQDTLKLKSKLFDNSDLKYRADLYSMKYTPTALAEEIFATVFKLLKSLEFNQTEMMLEPLDFTVSLELLEQIRLRDVMLILSCCIGYCNGFIIRPKITDKQYSRVYSIFTAISSETRKLLGFNNYDIGSALQTICLQLVEEIASYPLHKELVDDKNRFRQKVIDETGGDMKWVKTELSKIDNLDNMPKKYEQYPTLKVYFKEATPLRTEIISGAEPMLLSRAKDFAKSKWKKIWNESKKDYDFVEDGKKESSIFFFIWTQWERQIRESMMSCFDNPESCHQVHDAVYSKQQIEPGIIEAKVLEETGFEVKISTD